MSRNRGREILKELEGKKTLAFTDLVKWMTEAFGSPRNKGSSHHVFKMPWAGNPRVNLQRDGKGAKRYRIKQCQAALEKYVDHTEPKENENA